MQRNALIVLAFLMLCGIAGAQDLSPKECGSCHESQFKLWTAAKHNQRGIVCSACHGAFHSGSLNGCTSCHTGEHKLQYKEWEFVKDYIVEGDTSDYYCITCHDPHHPIKEKVLLCNTCHGTSVAEPQPRKAIRASIQKAHDNFARIGPEMDEDAWNRRMKSTSGKLMIGGAVLLVGGLLLFPYAFTFVAFLRWIKRKIRKQ